MPQTAEEKRAYRKAYREKNKEKIAAQKKAYREQNKEKERARQKEYYENNKEKIAAREKAYREGNKEKIAAKDKAYREKNKQKIAAGRKEHYEKNKEKIALWIKAYSQTEQGMKVRRISKWKYYGVICDDWNALYEKYKNTTHCEDCGVLLTEDKRNTKTTRCLDHNHQTGEFRNILCHSCNVRRG